MESSVTASRGVLLCLLESQEQFDNAPVAVKQPVSRACLDVVAHWHAGIGCVQVCFSKLDQFGSLDRLDVCRCETEQHIFSRYNARTHCIVIVLIGEPRPYAKPLQLPQLSPKLFAGRGPDPPPHGLATSPTC